MTSTSSVRVLNTYTKIILKPQEKDYCVPAIRGKTMDELLFDLFSLATPMGFEQHMYTFLPLKDAIIDDCGNVIIRIGGKQGKDFTTMFSCHLDTVQPRPKNKSKQPLKITPMIITDDCERINDVGMIYGARRKDIDNKKTLIPCVLGADDKIGIFLMIHMINKKIPGLYIFHTGEEAGGIGSKFIANNQPEQVKGIKRAIALDRMNYTDVIAFQIGGRCCSKEFGTALAKQLNEKMKLPFSEYKTEIRGTFTDTATYRSLIPECTNLSVGYFNQHTPSEHFDQLWLLNNFLPNLLEIEWETLPTIRDPKKVTSYYSSHHDYSNDGFGFPRGNTVIPLTRGKVIRKPFLSEVKNLILATASSLVPLWEPDCGLIEGASNEAMKRVIEKWADTLTVHTGIEKAKIIFRLMQKLEEQETEINALKDQVNDIIGSEDEEEDYDDGDISGTDINGKIIMATNAANNKLQNKYIASGSSVMDELLAEYNTWFASVKKSTGSGPNSFDVINFCLENIGKSKTRLFENIIPPEKIETHIRAVHKLIFEYLCFYKALTILNSNKDYKIASQRFERTLEACAEYIVKAFLDGVLTHGELKEYQISINKVLDNCNVRDLDMGQEFETLTYETA